MGKEFSRASQVRRAAIYSVGMAGGVALALLVMFGLLDDAIEMRLYKNCLSVRPKNKLSDISEF
ncbi:hypothetical protein HAP41_0000015910 [Bradyrhizobium barranii subsp. apii]|uniref:Uncharacterized protein n=1 Tax=Bradyrhizobium barranii subsp. apii TaxID=2819348 RepID=A0A8T5VLE1_9BRAD|nr:hypothetical protein [Bradyrhizobium barranii]UPT90294.1 hypothetical protein HAP41_0000015910 [Bradyrhizobium barranii subsp. apii]